MKKFLLLTFFSFGLINVYAQDSSAVRGAMSLKECLDYALENHPSIKNSQLDIKISQAKVKETTGLGLPQVKGQVDYLRNLEVQSQFVPANAFEPSAPENVIVPLGFGVDHTMNANLKVNQLIFDGSYLVGLKASKVYKSLSKENIELTKKDVRGNVIISYVLTLISQKYLDLVTENQKSLDSLLRDTKIMQENGFAEMVDVQRLQASINRGKVQVVTAENNLKSSRQLLNYQMGLDLDTEFELSQSLEELTEGKKQVDENTPAVDFAERHDYQALQIQKELNSLDVKNNKVAALPKIYAFASLGYNTGAIQFSDLMDNWQSYSMVGLTLSWDIFTGFQRKNKIDQAKYNLAKSENDIQQMQKTIEYQVYDSHLKLKNQLALLETNFENYQLSEEIFKSTKIKYLEGTAANIEVVEASTEVIAAQREYYTTLYNAIVAKIEMEDALGHIPSEY